MIGFLIRIWIRNVDIRTLILAIYVLECQTLPQHYPATVWVLINFVSPF